MTSCECSPAKADKHRSSHESRLYVNSGGGVLQGRVPLSFVNVWGVKLLHLPALRGIANRYGTEPTWDAMFLKAAALEKNDFSDLVPYWCLSDQDSNGVKLERIVPMYPMSQDKGRYLRLIKILSLYRLTLGQPRQEELIEVLDREIVGEVSDDLFIDLSPFRRKQAT